MFSVFSALTVAEGFIPIMHGMIHAPKPYSFGYTVKDKHGEQHRAESGDGHAVHGSYGFTDERGIHRQVEYVADHAGFRATVKTNEPGTAPADPAAVKMISSAHPYYGTGIGILGGGLLHGGLHSIGDGLHGIAGLHGGALHGIHGVPLAYPPPLVAPPPAPVAPVPVKGVGLEGGYGVPLLGGVVRGYDTRFGAFK